MKTNNQQISSMASYFDGNTWQLIGYRILTALITGITLGIAFPWAICMQIRWETKHTVINGRRLRFEGRGIQLLGKYLLWVFLTVITFGIFGLWMGLKMKKWIVKHTVYEDDDSGCESRFSGGMGGFLGIRLLAGLITAVTAGIGFAWGQKKILAWEAKHTHIGGSPLVFNGTGGQLFVKYLILALLTPLTLGIYVLFFPVKFLRWKYSNTDAVYQTEAVQKKARAHEVEAGLDYARFHLAANDTELAILKSGLAGNETQQQLEELVGGGNPYAMYRLAKLLKGDGACYEGRALELLMSASDAGYHVAMFDYAMQLQEQDIRMKLLEAAAQRGNHDAPWLLKEFYQQQTTQDAMINQAYWFKLAMEWNDPQALQSADTYEFLVKRIALNLAEASSQKTKFPVLGIVLGVIGGLIALLAIVAVFAMFMKRVSSGPMDSGNAFYGDVFGPDSSDEAVYGWIEGSWCALIQEGYTGIMVRNVTFNPDGTFEYGALTYSEASAEEADVKAYDKYWWVTGGGSYEGTYTIDGNEITFFSPANLQYPEDSTWTWEILAERNTFRVMMDTGEAVFVRGSEPDFDRTNSESLHGLVGTWRTAYRDGTSIRTDYVTLREDGSCECFRQEYYHTDFVPMEGEYGWYVKPVGWPTETGTYTLEDGVLTLTVVDDYGGPGTVVYEVSNIGAEHVELNGITYISAEAYPDVGVWELCEILNVDTGTN